MIFCYGSNLAGIHGAGAALHAYKHEGAVMHIGVGHRGNSYGIPTKDENIVTLPLNIIHVYVDQFISYALKHPELEFKITRIGCGLAGYTNAEIAPLFTHAPDNCWFDLAWMDYLPAGKHYWN